MCDDWRSFTKGKPNPVALVSTVVTRKSPTQPSSRFPEMNPATTTRPAIIPSRLNTT